MCSASEQMRNGPTSPGPRVSPPVMWVKGMKHQHPMGDDNHQESYVSVRARALSQRGTARQGEVTHDMQVLYKFWSHFLYSNFNPTMYSEFRTFAMEDAARTSSIGAHSLIAYYDEVLISKKKVIPDFIAQDYVDFVKSEEGRAERPGLAKLRTAWRNGALDLKSRKKIDKLIDQQLRNDLEA